jgi:hypothetical protein
MNGEPRFIPEMPGKTPALLAEKSLNNRIIL